MGYRIEYTSMEVKQEKMKRRKGIQWMAAVACLIGVIAGIRFCGLDDTVRDLLMPQGGITAMSALEEFAENIRSGENAAEAFTVFCREILENAQVE